jgi:ATP-dependent DNA ligase
MLAVPSRIGAPQEDDRVRLYSRLGNDLTQRFPSVVEALHGLHLHASRAGPLQPAS